MNKALNESDQKQKILNITDTTLRDAHQSLWATRMRTDDILGIIDVIDQAGYYSLEVWGGATFDVCLRFLRENPWDRLRKIKERAKNTPLQMLLRGQNLVGYRNYADDVVDRFIRLACENGMNIFRIFDALNDTRNVESAIRSVKKYGGHAQGTISYTISPVHTIDKFVQYAKEQAQVGVDSICIKDMAGILSPTAADELISALVENVGIPVQLHCHATSGMAYATYISGIQAGAEAFDCAIGPMAGFSSQPPVETMVSIFKETEYSVDLDMNALMKISKYFNNLAPERKPNTSMQSVIDSDVLIHQIPGGMISNFRSQLEAQNALDKLPEALEEVSRVRKDLGYPPLVTPMSQIVGTQSVMNILSGERYKLVPNEVKEYFKGSYGSSPAPLDEDIIKKIINDEERITCRPADLIEPMLPNATDNIDPKLLENEEDIISYCIFPEPALEYFKWRNLPTNERPEIPADLENKKNKKEKSEEMDNMKKIVHPEDWDYLNKLIKSAAQMNLNELSITKGELKISLKGAGSSNQTSINQREIQVDKPSEENEQIDSVNKQEKKENEGNISGKSINSPLAGTFYSGPGSGKAPFAKVGDIVDKGEKICIVEAMKLYNEIWTNEKCKILKYLVKDGESITKDQPLILIEEI